MHPTGTALLVVPQCCNRGQDTPFRVVLGDALDEHLADFKEDAVV